MATRVAKFDSATLTQKSLGVLFWLVFVICNGCSVARFMTAELAPITAITANTRSDVNMITARIDYRFGWGA